MNKEKTFGILKGYSFRFEADRNKIDVWFSGLSGLEIVHANGRLVAKKRCLLTNSSHVFSIGENEYSINIKVISLLRGPVICTLNKDGVNYKRQFINIDFVEERKSNRFIALILIWFMLVAGFYVLFTYLRHLPLIALLIAIALVVLASCIFNRAIGKSCKYTIEDEDVF